MVTSEPLNITASALYTGPRDGDPLTEGELSLLLAIPRAAQATPNATLFRLPRGPDPAMGWVDVTCAEARSIVARLAAHWDTKLSELLSKRTGGAISTVGPGTIICMLIQPSVHALFHLLAFWALGCTIQYVSIYLGEDIVDALLDQSGCQVVLYSGLDDAWVNRRRDHFVGDIIELPEEEQAHQLSLSEKQRKAELIHPWPAPRRPIPAIILQSSASTGTPKLFKYSLYFYTIGLSLDCQNYLSLADPLLPKSKSPYTHPRLLFAPPYWQSFYINFFTHLVTATPVAFAHIPDIHKLTSSQFMAWARCLDVGATTCSVYFLRDVLALGLDSDIKFIQSLRAIGIGGSAVDEWLSARCRELQLPVMNMFGLSEFGRVLHAPSPPYTHLRPYRDVPPPLALPISGSQGSDHQPGSRQVQLWYTVSSSPHLAHLLTQGGIPVKVEPFPGQGPHHGEIAVNWGDVFQEVKVPSSTITGGSEIAYVHLGRMDDTIRFSGGGDGDMNASEYEVQLRPALESRLKGTSWALDAIQLFGSGLPSTALVIQLSQSKQGDNLGDDVIRALFASVNEVNKNLELIPRQRVHCGKRVLIVTPEGLHGPGAERLGKEVRLMVTHKHTLRRWVNVQGFQPWLDGLDYGEP